MQRDRAQPGPFIGIGGLAVAAFLYGYVAIALPSVLHSVVLPAFWVLLLVLACVWFTPHPRRVMFLPALAIVVWFAVLLVAR
ncbi:MAG: hypothetical protein HOQ45_09715 [Nocardioidaceae bacterium]|nr:hypothetical protein [Nocardioidaceae bacterium]